MATVTIKSSGSGTGNFTLEPPTTNTDRTVVLPDEAGTVLTNASDIESQVKTATNATGSAPVYACRAWVNFDGTGTVSIRESGNVSSITDFGPGKYIINFNTAMPDTNFATLIQTRSRGTTAGLDDGQISVSQVGIQISDFSLNYTDSGITSVSVFR